MDDFLPQTTRTAETEHGHEANKLSVRGLVLFATALVALTTVVELILGGVMNGLYMESKTQRSPSLFQEDPGTFPAPRLQDNPAGEFAAFKQAELSHLNGYGWVEEEKGIAHIPIDRAIEILAERGLPKGSGVGRSAHAGGSRRARPVAQRPSHTSPKRQRGSPALDPKPARIASQEPREPKIGGRPRTMTIRRTPTGPHGNRLDIRRLGGAGRACPGAIRRRGQSGGLRSETGRATPARPPVSATTPAASSPWPSSSAGGPSSWSRSITAARCSATSY